MKNIVKILYFIFYSNYCIADTLKYFSCDNDEDAIKCANSCTWIGKIEINFEEIDLEGLKIDFFLKDGSAKTEILKNCEFKHSNDWYCSTVYSDLVNLNSDGYKIFQMIDGRYSEQYNFYDRNLSIFCIHKNFSDNFFYFCKVDF